MHAAKLKEQEMEQMSRNSADYVITESAMEKTIQQLRFLKGLENAIKYANSDDARAAAILQQQQYQTYDSLLRQEEQAHF